MTDQLTGNVEGYDPLFGGGQSRPSIFTKVNGIGDKVSGIISEVPFDRQSRFMDEDENGRPIAGGLKFWDEANKPSEVAVGPGGKERKPVMDTVIPLSTSLRDRGTDDDGERAWYLGGKPALDAFRKAIQAAGISSRQQLKGMRLTAWRTGKSGRAWLYEAVLERDPDRNAF